MTRSPKPVFFRSMKQCAGMLGIPVSTLKDWKRQGCPAWKWGRIYHAALLKFIAAEKSRGQTTAKKRVAAITQALTGLAACREVGILDEVEYFDLAKMIAERSPVIFVRWVKDYVGD